MSTPPTITPPSLVVPLVDADGRISKEWLPVIQAMIKKLNGL